MFFRLKLVISNHCIKSFFQVWIQLSIEFTLCALNHISIWSFIFPNEFPGVDRSFHSRKMLEDILKTRNYKAGENIVIKERVVVISLFIRRRILAISVECLQLLRMSSFSGLLMSGNFT